MHPTTVRGCALALALALLATSMVNAVPGAATAAAAQRRPRPQQLQAVRAAFVGNSYTFYQDLPSMLTSIVAAVRPQPSRPLPRMHGCARS